MPPGQGQRNLADADHLAVLLPSGPPEPPPPATTGTATWSRPRSRLATVSRSSSVAWSIAMPQRLNPAVMVAGVWPQPMVVAASQVAPLMTYMLSPPNGTVLVTTFVA